MTTHYLRFPDESTGLAALDAAGLLDADGNPITASHTHAIDVLGPISLPGTYNPETGDELTPPNPLPGWHVNLIGELPETWAAYAVYPKRPMRVFA
jgi:hypothetical protein